MSALLNLHNYVHGTICTTVYVCMYVCIPPFYRGSVRMNIMSPVANEMERFWV